MICNFCGEDFPEKEIEESHDVPCYLFIYSGARNLRKYEADKFGRRWLCTRCHKEYEKNLNNLLKSIAKTYSFHYFNKIGVEHGNTATT